MRKREIGKLVLESGCIIDPNHTSSRGYILISVDGRPKVLHRLKWEEANGPIPEGYELHHKCRNKACYNLDHLELLSTVDHIARHKEDNITDFLAGNKDVDQSTVYKWRRQGLIPTKPSYLEERIQKYLSGEIQICRTTHWKWRKAGLIAA